MMVMNIIPDFRSFIEKMVLDYNKVIPGSVRTSGVLLLPKL